MFSREHALDIARFTRASDGDVFFVVLRSFCAVSSGVEIDGIVEDGFRNALFCVFLEDFIGVSELSSLQSRQDGIVLVGSGRSAEGIEPIVVIESGLVFFIF